MEGSVRVGDEDRIGRAIRGATDLVRLTRPAIASGHELRAKTFWEVAAEAGLRTVVVNWWATWPAGGSGVNAPVILSDRATLRLERGGELDAEIAPKEAYDKLRAVWPAVKERAAQAAARVLPQTADPAISAIIRRSAELDALQILLLNHVEEDATDLVAVYLPGLDIAQHTLLGAGDSAAPSTLAARLDAVRAYYEYLSDLVARPRRRSAARQRAGVDRHATRDGCRPHHRPDCRHRPNVFVARRQTTRVRSMSRRQFFTRLGFLSARSWPGGRSCRCSAPSVVQKFPVREVPSYGPRRPPTAFRQGQPLDEEMVERLRSLGYVR